MATAAKGWCWVGMTLAVVACGKAETAQSEAAVDAGHAGSLGHGGSVGAAGDAGSGGASPAQSCPLQSEGFATTWGSRNQLEPSSSSCGVPASTLGPPQQPDECGCEGRSCRAGDTCVRVDQFAPSGLGGPATVRNGCFPLCQTDADCMAPAVCVTNVYGLLVCATPQCRSNDDCDRDDCGACLPGQVPAHGANYLDASGSRCSYAGSCDASSCAGCFESSPGHTCPL